MRATVLYFCDILDIRCQRFTSFEDRAPLFEAFQSTMAKRETICMRVCLDNVECQAFSWGRRTELCELFNSTLFSESGDANSALFLPVCI